MKFSSLIDVSLKTCYNTLAFNRLTSGFLTAVLRNLGDKLFRRHKPKGFPVGICMYNPKGVSL